MDNELISALEGRIEALLESWSELKSENLRLAGENERLRSDRDTVRSRLDTILKKLEGF